MSPEGGEREGWDVRGDPSRLKLRRAAVSAAASARLSYAAVVAIMVLALGAVIGAVAFRIFYVHTDYQRKTRGYNERQFRLKGDALATRAAEICLAYLQAGEAVERRNEQPLECFREDPGVYGLILKNLAGGSSRSFVLEKIGKDLELFEEPRRISVGPKTVVLRDGTVGLLARRGRGEIELRTKGSGKIVRRPETELFLEIQTKMYHAREAKPGGRGLRVFTRPVYSPETRNIEGQVIVYLHEHRRDLAPIATPEGWGEEEEEKKKEKKGKSRGTGE